MYYVQGGLSLCNIFVVKSFGKCTKLYK